MSTASNRPQRFALPRCRRLVSDLLHAQRTIPSVAHDRIIDLAELSLVRRQCPRRISWAALFLKSYALVSARHAALRQCYMSFPWPHVYQHPAVVATVAVSREYRGEDWLFFGRLRQPDQMSLEQVQDKLDDFQQRPVDQKYRCQLMLAKLPLVIRRAWWWARMNLSGQKRLGRMGTFGLSSIASLGATIQHPKAPVTSALTYGPFDEVGRTRVTIAYDHRLMDGRFIARVLGELEETLHGAILSELEGLAPHRLRIVA